MNNNEIFLKYIRSNEIEKVYPLISTKEVDINFVDKFGSTALSIAVADGNEKLVKILLDYGASVGTEYKNEASILHIACNYNNIVIVRLLIESRVNINELDKYGNNALWTATFNARGYYEVVELLLRNGADINSVNNAGRSPLDFAKQINDTNLVELMKKKVSN